MRRSDTSRDEDAGSDVEIASGYMPRERDLSRDKAIICR